MPIYFYWIKIGEEWEIVTKDIYDAFDGEKEIAPSAFAGVFW